MVFAPVWQTEFRILFDILSFFQMPMSASEVVGIETRNPEGGCYLVKAGGSGSGSGYSGHCADEVGGFSPGASTSSSHQPQPHHFNVQESTLVISNSSTCTLKLQSSSGPFSSKTKNYTVQFNKETTKTTTSSQVNIFFAKKSHLSWT